MGLEYLKEGYYNIGISVMMLAERTHSYEIASTKRSQLLTKIINGLRAHIEKHKIETAEVVVRGISRKEFVFNVTPQLNNYKVEMEKAKEKVETSMWIEKIEENLDANSESEPSKDIFDIVDEIEKKDSQLEPKHTPVEPIKLKLTASQAQMLKQSQMAWNFLRFKCPLMRASAMLAKLEGDSLKWEGSELKEGQDVQHIIEQMHWRPAQQIYELLDLYDYMMEASKKKVLITKNEILKKYQSPRQRQYKETRYEVPMQGKYLWMKTDYPKIVNSENSEPKYLSWQSPSTLLAVAKVISQTTDYKRTPKTRRFILKLKRTDAASSVVQNYLLEIKLRLFKLQHSNRITEEMDIGLIDNARRDLFELHINYDPCNSYEQFAVNEKRNFVMTNFRIDGGEYSIDINNQLLRRYLQENFYCYFTGRGPVFNCAVMAQYEAPLRQFISRINTVVKHIYPLDSADAVYWKQHLTKQIHKHAQSVGFSYELKSGGVEISCSSQAIYKQAQQRLDQLKKAIKLQYVHIKRKDELIAVELLRDRCSRYPSIQLKVFDCYKEGTPKDNRSIQFCGMLLIVHQATVLKKSDHVDFSRFFQEESVKYRNFCYFLSLDAEERAIAEAVEMLRKTVLSSQKHINLLVEEQQFKQFVQTLREIEERFKEGRITPRRMDVNIYTSRTAVLREYLHRCLTTDEQSEYITARLKGIGSECEQLIQWHKKQFVQKPRIIVECNHNTAKSLLERLKNVYRSQEICEVEGDQLSISSPSRVEITRMLTACIKKANIG